MLSPRQPGMKHWSGPALHSTHTPQVQLPSEVRWQWPGLTDRRAGMSKDPGPSPIEKLEVGSVARDPHLHDPNKSYKT